MTLQRRRHKCQQERVTLRLLPRERVAKEADKREFTSREIKEYVHFLELLPFHLCSPDNVSLSSNKDCHH